MLLPTDREHLLDDKSPLRVLRPLLVTRVLTLSAIDASSSAILDRAKVSVDAASEATGVLIVSTVLIRVLRTVSGISIPFLWGGLLLAEET